MRLSLRTKQVLGVTALVGAVVVVLSLIDLGQQARVRLEESQARGVLLAQAIYQRAFAIVPEAADPYYALREDGGMRNILEASIYSKGVTYAAIVDTSGIVIAHYDPEQIGKPLPDAPQLEDLVKLGGMAELYEIFFGDGRTYEVREPLKIGRLAGVTRIGISTLLIRNVLQETLQPVFIRALYLLAGATLGALLLAQWLLRPIHVLRSGLKRLERGEPAATLDLPQDEFGELGKELRAVSEKLLAGREATAGPQLGVDSIVENLADAVGIFGPKGDPLFVNPALRALLHASERDGSHPFRDLVDRTLDSRVPAEPTTMTLPAGEGETGHARLAGERESRRRQGRPAARRDGARARPRGAGRGRVDDQVFAQARRAGAAHLRRRARGEEPAQRDDDSSRVAEGQAGAAARRRRRSGRAWRPGGARARRRHRQRDSPARSGGAGLLEVHAARGPPAAAGARARSAHGDRCASSSPTPRPTECECRWTARLVFPMCRAIPARFVRRC